MTDETAADGTPTPDLQLSADEAAEQEYLRRYNPRGFPPIAVTVDMVLFAVQADELRVLLIKRAGHPHRGRWALPGGFVMPDEDLDTAAARELAEETGASVQGAHVEQLQCYGHPDRDPRMRIVSVAYLAFVPGVPRVTAGSDAGDARLWPVADLLAEGGDGAPRLAFDHRRILADAVRRARCRLETTNLGAAFLDGPFTLTGLRRVYEAVWGAPTDPVEFERWVLAAPGFLVPAGDEPAGTHATEPLYTRGPVTSLPSPIRRLPG